MTLARTPAILALIIGTFLAGCGGGQGTNGNNSGTGPGANSNSTRNSVEELGLIVNIPYEAEDAVWKEDKASRRLVAVLRFDSIDTGKLVADVEKVRAPESVIVAPQTWFPADLTADSDVRGVDEIPGKAYAADQFFQGDYTSGRLIKVDGNDYFILELTGRQQ